MRRKGFALVAALAALALLALAVSAFARPGSQSGTTTRVTVNMTEFKFALSKKTAKKGTVAFRVVNKGTVGHDFKIKGKKTRILAAGRSATLRVVFTKAGRYRYLCTLPTHATAGMKGVFVVK
jgi:plastocyanin